jgi:alpha-mannosidase
VGSWQSAGVVQAGLSYNQPLLARLKSGCAALGDDGSFRPILSGSPGVVAASMKRAQRGDGVVIRLYESTGAAGLVRLSGLPSGASVTVVTVTEDVVGPATVVDGSVELALRPWQVVSLMVRR